MRLFPVPAVFALSAAPARADTPLDADAILVPAQP